MFIKLEESSRVRTESFLGLIIGISEIISNG